MIEYSIFLFAIWRSKRVANKKIQQTETEIEDDMSSDRKQLDMHYEIQSNIHKLRLQFFNQLWLVGSLFFLSLPVSTIFSIHFIQESNQQMFQTLIMTLAQIGVYFYLLYMMTNKSSKYYGATFRNQNILPGKIEWKYIKIKVNFYD